jgi:hypothetical protein
LEAEASGKAGAGAPAPAEAAKAAPAAAKRLRNSLLEVFMEQYNSRPRRHGNARVEKQKMTLFWPFFRVGLRISMKMWDLHRKTAPKKIIPKTLP